MCEPSTIAAGVLLVAGATTAAVASHNQAKAAQRNAQAQADARENAFRAGLKRQDQYAQENAAAFKNSTENQGAQSFEDALAENTANRLQAFRDSKAPGGDDYTFLSSTPGNVAAFKEQAFKEADDKVSRDNANLAQLSGYNDAGLQQDLGRNAYVRGFGNLQDKAQRDAALINMDINQAGNRAFKGPNQAVGLAGQIGKGAMMIGGSMLGGALGGAGAVAGSSAFSVNKTPTKNNQYAYYDSEADNPYQTYGG